MVDDDQGSCKKHSLIDFLYRRQRYAARRAAKRAEAAVRAREERERAAALDRAEAEARRRRRESHQRREREYDSHRARAKPDRSAPPRIVETKDESVTSAGLFIPTSNNDHRTKREAPSPTASRRRHHISSVPEPRQEAHIGERKTAEISRSRAHRSRSSRTESDSPRTRRTDGGRALPREEEKPRGLLGALKRLLG